MKKIILFLMFVAFNAFANDSTVTVQTVADYVCHDNKSKIIDFKTGNERITKEGLIYFKGIDKSQSQKIAFTETRRKTKIYSDFKKILDHIKDENLDLHTSELNTTCSEEYLKYQPAYKRSNLQIDVMDGNGKIIATRTFILGPKEHFFLSADLVLNDIKQLKRNTDGTLSEKETPQSFYLGFNYKMGDVISNNYENWMDTDRVSLKFMVEVSEKPAESLGLGIGVDTKIGNLFVANIWAKDDDSVGDNRDYTDSIVFGISFDISKGISWLKN